MKFSIKDFFSKYDQFCSFMQIWSHLLKKSFMENFNFCAVSQLQFLLHCYKVTDCYVNCLWQAFELNSPEINL